jgi:hypothetical protein
MTDKREPTMTDALRALARGGTAGGSAIDNLRRRWRDGEGSLSPETLREDPAFQSDPFQSVTRSAGSLEQALANMRATRSRMTARPTRKDQP